MQDSDSVLIQLSENMYLTRILTLTEISLSTFIIIIIFYFIYLASLVCFLSIILLETHYERIINPTE